MMCHKTSQFAFFSLILLLAAGCGQTAQPVEEPAVKVRVTRPVAREVTDYAYFTGRTGAVESVNVQSRVTGYLNSVNFKSGAMVKTGAKLFEIDPRPYQAALDRANSRVQLAEARLGLAKADYARAMEVSKTPGAISRQDIDRYAAAEAEAKAAVAAAEADSESSRLDVEFTDILSPINGVVGRNLLDVGNLVKQDVSLLTTVVSRDPMYVYFDVDEQIMLRVQRMMGRDGAPSPQQGGVYAVYVGLADEGDRFPHKGKIDFVNNRVGISTATIQVRAELPNPPMRKGSAPLLTPGLFVRVRLPVSLPHKALLVPQSALCTDQGDKYLLVVDQKNVVRRRPIKPGPEQADGLQVVTPVKMTSTSKAPGHVGKGRESGDSKKSDKNKKAVDSLTSSDRVITGGLQLVKPGMRVEAREEPDATKKPSGARGEASKQKMDPGATKKSSPSAEHDSAGKKRAPKTGS